MDFKRLSFILLFLSIIIGLIFWSKKNLSLLLEKYHIIDLPQFTTRKTVESITYIQKIASLPEKLENKTIVIASDFHFCSENQILPVLAVNEINKQNPDLVFLLGDFITDDPKGVETLANILKLIKAKKGVFAIFGNHDISWGQKGKARVRDALEKLANIKVLENEAIFPWGKDLAVPDKAFNNIDNNIPRIVLTHNPDSIFGFQEYRADLILCGHTHGGSIALPLIGSLYPYLKKCANYMPKTLIKKVPYGEHVFFVEHEEHIEGKYNLNQENKDKYPEGRTLIITRGIGSHFHGMRIFVPPEIMIIKLKKQ